MIQLISRGDDGFGDAAADGNALGSSATDAGSSDVSLFDGDFSLDSATTDAAGIAALPTVTSPDDTFNSLVSQADGDFGDSATDANTSALSATVGTQSDSNSFNGDLPPGSAAAAGILGFTPVTLADGGAYNFTAPVTAWSDSIGAPEVTPIFVTTDSAEQSPLTVNPAPPVTVADGATVAIDGASAQSVTFTGSTGILMLNDALAFTGQVSGLAGSDAIDLADLSYGANTTATFLGNADRWHAYRHQRDADCKHRPRGRLSIVILDGVQRWGWWHHRRRSDILQHLAAGQYRRRRLPRRHGRRSRWRDGGAH